MRYRIAYVNHVGQASGAERSLEALLCHLDRGTYDPLLVYPGPGPLDDVARRLGIEVRWLGLARFGRSWRPMGFAAGVARWSLTSCDLAGLIREDEIDLVHANSTTAHLFAGAASRAVGVPAVWHVRDLVRLGPVGRACRELATHTVAISGAVRRSVFGPGGRYAVSVVHNGIDADRFAARARAGRVRSELGLHGVPLVAVVGQLVPWKGHEAFLSAFSAVARDIPEAKALDVGADLFGDHPGREQFLMRRRDALGLRDSVLFLGQRDDVADILADCDVLAVPSRAEPFGRVALEAMALGKPVVGFDAGGLPEVVVDGETGVLVPRGSVGTLGEALLGLLRNPARARALGAAGRVRVRRLFSAGQMARRIESLYTTLLQRKGRR